MHEVKGSNTTFQNFLKTSYFFAYISHLASHAHIRMRIKIFIIFLAKPPLYVHTKSMKRLELNLPVTDKHFKPDYMQTKVIWLQM